MARLGTRSLRRTGADRETCYCICGDPEHSLMLWIPEDAEWFEQFGQIEVTVGMGMYPNLWRQRIRNAWRLLRGRDAPMADVILNYADTVALRDGLNRVLDVIEQKTEVGAS